jgi:hypothetical protein
MCNTSIWHKHKKGVRAGNSPIWPKGRTWSKMDVSNYDERTVKVHGIKGERKYKFDSEGTTKEIKKEAKEIYESEE